MPPNSEGEDQRREKLKEAGSRKFVESVLVAQTPLELVITVGDWCGWSFANRPKAPTLGDEVATVPCRRIMEARALIKRE